MGCRCYFNCYCGCCFPGKPDDYEGSSSGNSSPLKSQHDLESCQAVNVTEVPLRSNGGEHIPQLTFNQKCFLAVCMLGYMALVICVFAKVIPAQPDILVAGPVLLFLLTWFFAFQNESIFV